MLHFVNEEIKFKLGLIKQKIKQSNNAIFNSCLSFTKQKLINFYLLMILYFFKTKYVY